MRALAIAAVPSGHTTVADKSGIDFDVVYSDLLKPAIEAAGLEAVRAGSGSKAGALDPEAIQELLLAEVIVADLTLDDAEVGYRLGIRHALRARGAVLVHGPRDNLPSNLAGARHAYQYGLKDGRPDPETIERDLAASKEMIRGAVDDRNDSPLYRLLPDLREPHWKTLRVEAARQFWRTYEVFEKRVDRALAAGLIGDVLVLADEAPVAGMCAEALGKAGCALRQAGHYDFALEQVERSVALDPNNDNALREKAVCLHRLALLKQRGVTLTHAREQYRGLSDRNPNDPDAAAFLAEVDKDLWTQSWRDAQQKRNAAAAHDVLMHKAIESYLRSFRLNPAHYDSGINALTLMHLYRDLCGGRRYLAQIDTLAVAVGFAAGCEADDRRCVPAKAALAELQVLTGTPESTACAYREAVDCARDDRSALDAALARLYLLRELDFRPHCVRAGIAALEQARQALIYNDAAWQPRQVFLFSGHMIDRPGRNPPRFPKQREIDAARMIAEQLARLDANSDDLALTQGACGGDILFAEACLRRGVKLRFLQPFAEADFIERSVVPGGESWRERYWRLQPQLDSPPRAAPIELGPAPQRIDPYQRCNLWLLYTALTFGIDRVQFLCLWNGHGGDGPGGTEHMYREVRRRTGQVHWLDTRVWDEAR